MIETSTPASTTGRTASFYRPRIWHLSLLVLFVAIAIANIQDQRIQEPILIAIAGVGFALYGLIGSLGWWVARRWFGSRLGMSRLCALYAIAMAALFLAATVFYLLIEHFYRDGGF